MKELDIFFGAISRVSDLAERKYPAMNRLNAKSAATAMKAVLFNEIDRKEIEEIAKMTNSCRNNIINYATLIGTTAAARGIRKEKEKIAGRDRYENTQHQLFICRRHSAAHGELHSWISGLAPY